jgi:phosphotransferase system enzyme I (PtsI)
MFGKYLIDSVVYWAKEYHVDGFRFDLMAVHDTDTMNRLREELDKIDESIIIYGEGWMGGPSVFPFERACFKQNAKKVPHIAMFNDDIRDVIKGSVMDPEVAGFVNGELNASDEKVDILMNRMRFAVTGACGHPQVKLTDEMNGREAIVDGFEGKVYIDPDPDVLAEKKKILLQEQEKKTLLEQLKGKENVTLDGQKINLYANIGNTKDLALVLKNDAGGIGLFRSEFIYLGSDDYPTEEEQFAIYKQVAETMAGKKVIIRTLDIGADKQADYFNLPHEENPAMGLRAIRICLTRPEIFKTQLRAILRASAFGKISIMFPMIISVEEVKKIKDIVAEVKKELDADGLLYDKDIELGIMIETPAAVMMAEELAEEVDFFSVGTNDLTQYTLAIDRQNESLDEFYDSHHPGLLKMLKMIVDGAHKGGAWAGICGELGSDLSLTKEFLAMGYDELSVSPGRILPLRKVVLETNVSEYKEEKGYK